MNFANDSTVEIISSFVTAQISYWIARNPGYAYSEQIFLQLNETRKDIFVYKFFDGGVELLPKPGVDWDQPLGMHVRAPWYLHLFRMVLAEGNFLFEGTLAMSLEDLAEESKDFPIFSFQKKFGSNLILLPDIDTLQFNFYEDAQDDTRQYDDKSSSGIFIGATTGMAHSEESVAALVSQRLRSGVFFRDKPEVEFRLPMICQCLTPEAHQAIEALGFGVGPGDWAEQFEHKFLLTMDGNGATCSRVVIGLKSNSVPIKYLSPHQLYYFDALRPWYHYIPAYKDEDVLNVIHAERQRPGMFRHIARHGQKFYADFLSRKPTLAYTGQLLNAYFSCFAREARTFSKLKLTAIGHLANLGDVTFSDGEWIGAPGSGRALEGFQIDAPPQVALRYRIVDETGKRSPWSEACSFVGERGVALRLTGFAIESSTSAECVYYGHFLDGQEIGPVANGALCQSPTNAPLEAIRIEIV
ncbi:glycosyl transferase family 90 [Novosphingobium sp. KACC 22771]|uniref:glycosyl transferase family 90 n=1 Tax=Novosphingobium sp. KACC 22771 TaxID=3025670 RepID=UPI002366633F|nr:glycosyl transferase family 90 [Novosphingobium sp. KACC 22771]WDF72762.1 glycosyl transferase family 90 [Novosphingobium sp. KACC 22771]